MSYHFTNIHTILNLTQPLVILPFIFFETSFISPHKLNMENIINKQDIFKIKMTAYEITLVHLWQN